MVQSVKSSNRIVSSTVQERKIHVLHVDDDPAFLKVAEHCLKMQGEFQVETASSVEEAIAKMKKKKYDAIVSDYQMPEKDGLQFLEELRKKGNNIPFIMFTVKGREEIAVKALNLGADHYLNKTGDPETVYSELSHDIENMVRTRRAQQELRIQKEELQTILDSLPLQIWYKDKDNRLVRVNKRFAEYIGLSKKDLEGKPLCDLFPPDIALKCWEEDKEVIETGQKKIDILDRHESAQGPKWFLTSKVPYKDTDGKIIGTINFSSDITELKAAETSSADHALLESLVEFSDDAIIGKTLDGTIVSWNSGAQKIYGYASEEVIGKSISILVPPETQEELPKILDKIKRGEHVDRYSTKRVKKDHSRIDVSVTISPIKDIKGNIIGASTIARDITERKKVQEQLRKSEKKYRELYETSIDAIATSDMSGHFIDCNQSCLKMLGYTLDEMRNLTYQQLTPEKWRKKEAEIIEKEVMQKGYTAEYEKEQIRKDGTVIPVSNRVWATFDDDGKPKTMWGIVRDITERKKTEQTLRASLERYRSFVEVTGELGWTTNPEGEVVEDIPSFRKFTGQTFEEVKGWGWSKALHPDDLESTLKIWKEATRTKSKYEIEYRLRRHDGIYRYFMARGVPVFKEDGSIREWVGTCSDITERQQKEEELQESERKYRKIFEGSNDGIIEVDPSTRRIAFANPAIYRLTGYSERELLKMKVDDIHPKEALPFVMEQLEKLALGEMPHAEAIPVLKKDKSLIYCHITGSTLEIEKRNLAVAFFRDVTESKKAEEALMKSEEKYRTLVENIDDIVFTIDINGIMKYVSPFAEKLTGFKLDELVGKPFLNFFKPTEKETAHSNFTRILNGEAIRGAEATISGRDGTLVYYEANMYPVFSNGNIVGIQGIARDITERKHWNDELSASEERLSILFERAPDGYYLSDLKGNFIDGNKAAEEITGYSKSELIGRSFLKLGLLPRSQIPKAAKLLALNAVGKPTGPDELILSRKDGSQISVEIRTFPTEIQGRKLVLGIARDITQRKNAENLILESQQRFQSLFSNNPEATIYTDVDSTVVNINQRFTTLFGYSSNEVKGKNINDLIVPKDYVEEAEMLDRKAVEGYAQRDTVRMRKDKSSISVSISAAPVIVRGQLKGYVGVYKDISQLKKAEEELRETMEKLQVMNEKLRVVGSLTRHDVRNKLTAVTGNTYLARKKLPENSEVLEYLGQIEASAEQTVRVLEFAKNYEMLGVEQLDFVDVEKTFNEAISLFSGLNEIKVMNNCHGLTLLADSLLRQLFYNLIDDSLKYGKKLTWIKIHFEEKTDHMNIIYEDDGVGIPASEKPKLFNQGYSTGGSTGYGLYLIKKMTEVYGWTIKENGEAGKGAVFVITIPKTNESHRINYKLH